jgi:hypothetical protein
MVGEANFIVRFKEMSLGQTSQRNADKDDAALWALFVRTKVSRAVRSIKGLR